MVKIFENCIIQAPDGVNLGRCGTKKANWYLKKQLATLVGKNPLIIKLNFEPSGREGVNDPLLTHGKPNICVVCGIDEDLTRHHIIPYSFIKHMDIEYRVDIIRDIYPLCKDCHQDYEKHSNKKREKMADDLGLSMNGIEIELERKIRRVVSAASALSDYQSEIPVKRQKELYKIVKNHLRKEDVSKDDLDHLKNYKVTDHDEYVNFCKTIVDNIENYDDFAKDWRKHFVEMMNPQYMPKIWKIDRKTKNNWIPNKFKQ